MTTIRVTSSATNAAGTAFGQQDDLLKPSYFDLYVTNSTDALLPDGTYDAYCLNPGEIIKVSPTTHTAQSYAGESEASYDPIGLAAITQTQVDRINWLLAQNFTWDPKFAGQFNYGEVQVALWTLLGFSAAGTDPRWLNDNNRNVVLQGDIDFLVSAAQSAVASGQGVSPVSDSFSRVIDPEGTVQPLIVQLQSAKLGNFVWLDANADGVQESGEAGIDGIVVKLYDGSGNYLASTITGDDHSTAAIEHGHYQFVGLQAGSYQVEFVTPGYQLTAQDVSTTDDTRDSDADVSTGRSQLVALGVGESNQTIDAGVYRTASLGDRLWVDTNANGVQDAGEAGIVGQTVTLIGGGADGLINGVGDTTTTTTTGADGIYGFTGLTPGVQYQVQFSAPAGTLFTGQDLGDDDAKDSDVDTTTGKTQIVTLTSGENNPTLDAGVYAPATLGNKVFEDTNGNGKQEGTEPGIVGATVTLFTCVDGQPGVQVGAPVQTDGNGNYSFTGLKPGDYIVQFTTPAGGYTQTTANVGGDDELDSDAGTGGLTGCYTLTSGQTNDTVDAGFYRAAIDIEKLVRGEYQSGGNGGTEGLTPGFWKTHSQFGPAPLAGWPETGYSPTQSWESVFGKDVPGTPTLLDALNTGGGGLDALLRHSTAALLNAANPNVDYAYSVTQVISMTQSAITSGNYDATKNLFELQNEKGADLSTPATSLTLVVTPDFDADTPGSGPQIPVGGKAVFTYIVTNTGSVEISNVSVTDNRLTGLTYLGGDSDSDSKLDVGEVWRYKAEEIVTSSAEVANTGTVTGTGGTVPVTDSDQAHYNGSPLAQSLGDFVWMDANRNGLQDNSEAGIGGVTVTLIGGGANGIIGTGGDDTTVTSTTDANGYYQFSNLAAGVQYQVTFSKPANTAFTTQDVNGNGDDTTDSDANPSTGKSHIVTLTPGQNNPTIDAGVFALASIGDRVWLDCDGDGVQNANEVGVADVTVRLINSTGAVERTTTTNYTGNYLFDNLQPGDYSIQVVRPDGYLFTLANQGSDDEKDSDVDATTGRTTVTSLSSGESDLSWDAGLTTTAVCLDLDLTGNTNTGGNAAGNIRTISQAGLDVHASAFSRVKATGEWSQAYLGSYGGGLGVTDGSEGDGSNNTHTVDNLGGRDNYVLFEFDQTVLLDEAFLGYVVNDSDLQVWIGTFDRPFDNHLALNDGVLGSMSFSEVNTTTLTGPRWADLNAGDHAGNVIVIAADTTDKSPEDMFKIEMLKLCTPACGLTARIGDRVWEDRNYNGIQDSGEIGIANVTVKLLDASGSVLRTTTTSSSGYYSFDVDPGSYKVQVVRPSGYHATKGNQGSNDAVDSDIDGSGLTQTYTVSGGQTNLTIDAGLYRKASVGDKVWDDMDHDNIQDASEPGVKGITVKLLNSSGTVLQTKTTDAYGNYKFTDLNPGTYQLQFDKTNVQYYQYGQWNNMSNWKWAVKDAGSNDQIDSDVAGNAVDKTNVTKTSTFTLTSGQSDMSRDAGITPIVIDLDGNGIQTISRSDGAGTFDLLGNGSAVASGWISGGDGFLAVDRNGDGRISGIGELFGGTAKGAGFAQLLDYDSNADGLISAADSGFADLRIWRDANGNRATDDGELMTLSEAGVISLDVAYTEVPFLDRQGNLHLERSSVTMADGRSADMTDVYFAVAAEDATAAGIELPDLASLIEGNQAAPVSDAGWLFV